MFNWIYNHITLWKYFCVCENIYYVYKRAVLLFGILYGQDIIRDFLVVLITVLVPFAPAPFSYYSKEYMVALVIRLYLFVLIWIILVK